MATVHSESPERDPLEEVADAYLARLRAGEQPALSEYQRAHPELANDIAELFPALLMMEAGRKCVEQPAEPDPARLTDEQVPRELGEYRLVREVGRGGMGVVYEAWQESLGRHVALKVLPFNNLARPEHLERFRREARAAARLHHTNIVPVFGVGEHEGIHYYAMQFIHGQGLDAVLDEVRRLRNAQGESTATKALASTIAGKLLSGRANHPAAVETPGSGSPPAANAAAPNLTLDSQDRYFASVARLGAQAAEALEYAHGQGVIHRDIKPSNLLLDTDGQVWITDFGLAKAEDSDVLTSPGDILGTVRYMAPERFQGQADGRSDIYGLGITLYELLTLHPAFEHSNRGLLVEQIARLEPTGPRKFNPHIPLDLETIVLKAMAKEPARRYTRAGEMADDLRRFLADRPIRARRTPWRERAWRWCRRNPTVAALLGCVGALLLAIAGGAGWMARDEAARQAALDRQADTILDGAVALMEQAKWQEALAAIERADELLVSAGRGQRPPRLAELARDVRMVRRLEAIYSRPKEDDLDYSAQQDAEYAEALRDYGIDVAVQSADEAAARIRARSIRRELALALDFWSLVRQRAARDQVPDWKRLLEIAQAADPDPFRNQLRDALARMDRNALVALAVTADVARLPPQTLALLGGALTAGPKPGRFSPAFVQRKSDDTLTPERIGKFLRAARRQYPGDLWITSTLAAYCGSRGQYDEAVRFYTAALVLRPNNPHFVYSLGDALLAKGSPQEAVTEYSWVIARQSNHVDAVIQRGRAYARLRQPDKVLEDFSRAIELGYQLPQAWYWRGWAYTQLRQWDEAIVEFSNCVNKLASVHAFDKFRTGWAVPPDLRSHRAYCYSVVGQWDKAVADLQAARLHSAPLKSVQPHDDLWFQLACLHLLQGDLTGYRQLCQQLCLRAPTRGFSGRAAYMAARTCALHPDGSTAAVQAVRLAEKELASDPKAPWYLHTVALAHYGAGEYEKCIRYARESQQAGSRWEGNMVNTLLLALAHQRHGQLDEARQCMKLAALWRKDVLAGTYKGNAAPPDMHLSDWLGFQLLWTEAERRSGR